MKKILSLCVSALLIFTLCACGKNNTSSKCDCGKNNSQSDLIAIPDFTGVNKDEAIKKIKALGLNVETSTQHLCTLLNMKDIPKANTVLWQSGMFFHPGSTVEIRYATDETVFDYKENKDGTITLTGVEAYYSENKTLVIPPTYLGKTVSSVNFSSTDIFAVGWKIKVHKKVKIENAFQNPVIFY